MQKTIISISCDNCGHHIVEGHEHLVLIHIDGTEYSTDWCIDCLQALKQKIAPDQPELTCSCGFVGRSERGLATHQRRMGHS